MLTSWFEIVEGVLERKSSISENEIWSRFEKGCFHLEWGEEDGWRRRFDLTAILVVRGVIGILVSLALCCHRNISS